MPFTVQEIIENISGDYNIVGNIEQSIEIDNLKPTNIANERSLVFVAPNRDDKQTLAENTKAKLIICDKEVEATAKMKDKVLIQVEKPKFVFAIIGNKFFVKQYEQGIHPSAIIHPEAEIDATAYIGPHSYIGKAKIGAGTQVHGNVYIYDNVSIGNNVILKAGCIIGSHGYGYVRNEDRLPIKFPHIGEVIIEDEVEIGANACIDAGTLGETVIGYGSKIDNLVHIGHNVRIGKCVYIAAQTAIAGSSQIGDFTEIWMSAGIADYSKIGKDATVGIGSVVIKDIPEETSVFGNPARKFKQR